MPEEKAIVTDIPGTTRDSIEEYANIGGVPLRLADTAGIRTIDDVVEKIGVEKALAEAMLVLFLVYLPIKRQEMYILRKLAVNQTKRMIVDGLP